MILALRGTGFVLPALCDTELRLRHWCCGTDVVALVLWYWPCGTGVAVLTL